MLEGRKSSLLRSNTLTSVVDGNVKLLNDLLHLTSQWSDQSRDFPGMSEIMLIAYIGLLFR
jgi:hypothetical protein